MKNPATHTQKHPHTSMWAAQPGACIWTGSTTLNLNFSHLRWQSFHVAQAGLQLLSSSNLLASASRVPEPQIPPSLVLGFLNSHWVSEDLGSPTNQHNELRVGQSWLGNKAWSWAANDLLSAHMSLCMPMNTELGAMRVSSCQCPLVYSKQLCRFCRVRFSQQCPTQAVPASRSHYHPQVPGFQKKKKKPIKMSTLVNQHRVVFSPGIFY